MVDPNAVLIDDFVKKCAEVELKKRHGDAVTLVSWRYEGIKRKKPQYTYGCEFKGIHHYGFSRFEDGEVLDTIVKDVSHSLEMFSRYQSGGWSLSHRNHIMLSLVRKYMLEGFGMDYEAISDSYGRGVPGEIVDRWIENSGLQLKGANNFSPVYQWLCENLSKEVFFEELERVFS